MILIKECDVILHNNKVAVISFDGTKVQIPHNKLIGNKAYIKFESGKYTVVTKADFDKQKANYASKLKKKPKDESKDLNSVMDNEERGYNSL